MLVIMNLEANFHEFLKLLPSGYSSQGSDGNVLRRVLEISTHVDTGHYAGQSREENSKDAEPVVMIRVVRLAVLVPNCRIPSVEAVF